MHDLPDSTDSSTKKPLWVARYTSTHERMFNEHFVRSARAIGLTEGFEIDFRKVALNAGTFGSPEFNQYSVDATQWFIDILRANPERIILNTGVDFHFYENFASDIIGRAEQGLYVAINDGCMPVCGDFACVRSTPAIIGIFEDLQRVMGHFSNHQEALNHVLANRKTPVCVLDETFWTVGIQLRTVWNPSDTIVLAPPRGIKLHHANWTVGPENKLILLERVEDIVNQAKV